MRDDVVLDVRNLTLRFGADKSGQGGLLAVNDVSFDLRRGETLSIVGESGSGKTTIGRCIARLYEPTAGQMTLQAKEGPVDLARLDKRALKSVRRQIQMLFQDPNASLNARMRIGDIVAEPLRIHRIGTPAEQRARVVQLLQRVGLGEDTVNRYPHQLSGGQRQRIGIARALTIDPHLLICDEPVSALDVSVQAQVLNLLGDLQQEFGLSYIFVSHDLGVVDYISDRVLVLYLGTVMELAHRDDLFARPAHPYTRALLDAMPARVGGVHRKRRLLKGEITGPSVTRTGCVFAGRCPHQTEICTRQVPPLRNWAVNPATQVACHHADQLNLTPGGAATSQGADT